MSTTNIDTLFFKCWRNIYIKKIIDHHVSLYGIHYHTREMEPEFLKQYEYKDYLRSIYFVDKENKEFDPLEYCSEGLQSIKFSYYFNKIINNSDHLKNHNYNNNITSIEFGYDFNQPLYNSKTKVTMLPHSLEILKFGRLYNQEFEPGCFSKLTKLESIEFGSKFNNKGLPIKVGVFPKSVTSIKFGHDHFTHLYVGVLPSGLKKLVFGQSLFQDVSAENGILPKSLTHLEFSPLYKVKLDFKIIFKLTNLTTLVYRGQSIDFETPNNSFPPSLSTLHCQWPASVNKETVQTLPESITSFNNNNINSDIPTLKLPITIKKLSVYHLLTLDSFSGGSNSQLEKMEIHLPLDHELNFKIPNDIPTFKTLKTNYDHGPLLLSDGQNSIIPNTITKLTLTDFNEEDLKNNSFPSSLTSLKLQKYNRQIDIDSSSKWWSNLKKLSFGNAFKFGLPLVNLTNLEELQVPISYYKHLKPEYLLNLKKLIFSIESSIVISRDEFCSKLPIGITYLELPNGLEFDKVLNEEDQDLSLLPNSITTLNITNNACSKLLNPLFPLPNHIENLISYKNNYKFLDDVTNIKQFSNQLKVINKYF